MSNWKRTFLKRPIFEGDAFVGLPYIPFVALMAFRIYSTYPKIFHWQFAIALLFSLPLQKVAAKISKKLIINHDIFRGPTVEYMINFLLQTILCGYLCQLAFGKFFLMCLLAAVHSFILGIFILYAMYRPGSTESTMISGTLVAFCLIFISITEFIFAMGRGGATNASMSKLIALAISFSIGCLSSMLGILKLKGLGRK